MGFIFLNGCETDTIDENPSIESSPYSQRPFIKVDDDLLEISQTFGDQTLEFKSHKDQNVVSSTFMVKNKNDEVIYKTDYSLDLNVPKFKLYQSEEVLKIANSLDYQLSKDDYTKVDMRFDSFFEEAFSNYYDSKLDALFAQLYFHKSIVSIKLRSLKLNTDCECTLHPGYLVDKIGFACQEDFYIPLEILKELVQNKEKQFPNEKEARLFEEHIQKQIKGNEVALSFDKIYSFYGSKEQYLNSLEDLKNENLRGCWFGQGSSHGCCGNYSGCCYYWNPICWAHDRMCTSCTPRWACFSGCVPD